MTAEQIKMLSDLKGSAERGAAGLVLNTRLATAHELVKLGLIEQHKIGYRITKKGLKVVK